MRFRHRRTSLLPEVSRAQKYCVTSYASVINLTTWYVVSRIIRGTLIKSRPTRHSCMHLHTDAPSPRHLNTPNRHKSLSITRQAPAPRVFVDLQRASDLSIKTWAPVSVGRLCLCTSMWFDETSETPFPPNRYPLFVVCSWECYIAIKTGNRWHLTSVTDGV